jgi:16S rRNA (cytidine1402-2'-O)-methyltransferase
MGILYIVATPIGNLEDITIRAIKTLFSVDIIAAEDTRRTGQLLAELKKRYPAFCHPNALPSHSREGGNLAFENEIPGSSPRMTSANDQKLISYYDEIEFKKMPELIGLLEEGKTIALVSDAGTPLIADPGYKLVHEALKRGIRVESIPGPSAILAALTSSGFPTHQFSFYGYVPEKESGRKKIFELLKQSEGTNIFYVAPHKLEQALLDMKEVFGNIEIALARELTKMHEEVWRGSVDDAMKAFSEPKGELVLLFSLS